MSETTNQGLVYIIIATGGGARRDAASCLRSRLLALLPEGTAVERRELPGVLWGFVTVENDRPDRVDHAVSGSLEVVLRGDPVWREPVSPRPALAPELLRLWELERTRTLERLDNLYLALVADGKTGELTVGTDITGGIRLYAARIGGCLLLATSYLLVSRLVEDKAPDGDSVATFFHLGYFPDSRTALRAVSVWPFASITTISRKSVRTELYWRPSMDIDRSKPLEDVLDGAVDAFNATVREYAAGHELVYLAMTAGLDSRTTATSLIHQGIPFKTYTHGFPGCWEERRVEPIVARHGIPHRFVPLAESFSDQIRELTLEAFSATDGEISSIEKSHLVYVLSLLREETDGRKVALFLGGGAGMLKGSFYRLLNEEERYTQAGIDGYIRWNLAKRLPGIFSPEVRAGDPTLLREFVTSAFDSVDGGTLFQKLDYFYLVRYRRWAGGVKSIYRRFFPVREPFVSRRILDYLFPVDPVIKKHKLPHFEILARNYRPLMYDLTNKMSPALPLSWKNLPRFLPSGWWHFKQVLRGFSRKYLPKELFPLVDYVNYSSWIRRPSGRSLVEELLDPARMRSAALYDEGRLRAWLAKQRAEGFGAFPLIDRMCTLELYFREIQGR